jgi:hypothetical protein
VSLQYLTYLHLTYLLRMGVDRAQKAAYQSRDFVRIGVEREMSGVKQAHVGA